MSDGTTDNPLQLLDRDRALARERADPCANLCTLASVDAAGNPQARTVVLRDLDGRLAIFTNETSPKWRQMDMSATLAVLVWLPSIDVQYRLQCETRPVPKPKVHENWQQRPEPAKRLDWFYTRTQAQSSVIADRDELLEEVDSLRLREPLIAPRTAAGVYLEPVSIERLNLATEVGIHDRVLYRHQAGGWQAATLVP